MSPAPATSILETGTVHLDKVMSSPARSTSLRRIVLTGFMGAGKTTVGRLLAAALNWEFLDVDAILEARTGQTIVQLFQTHGEPGFRQLESSALAHALGHSNAVIALGGGTPEILTNRLLLEQTPHTTVIFLDAPFPVLYDRCILQEDAAIRPVLQDPALAEQRFLQRRPIYRRVARHTILTEPHSAASTAQEILHRLALSSPQTA